MAAEATSVAENKTYGFEYCKGARLPPLDIDGPESKLPCLDLLAPVPLSFEVDNSLVGSPN